MMMMMTALLWGGTSFCCSVVWFYGFLLGKRCCPTTLFAHVWAAFVEASGGSCWKNFGQLCLETWLLLLTRKTNPLDDGHDVHLPALRRRPRPRSLTCLRTYVLAPNGASICATLENTHAPPPHCYPTTLPRHPAQPPPPSSRTYFHPPANP
jgi:hypothetical protein